MQIEVRKADSGQIIFKDNVTASIAALVKGDYTGGGTDQVIVCATSREARHADSTVTAVHDGCS